MNIIKSIAYTLVLIGAINWGLVGFFEFDLVRFIFGDMTILSRIVYSLIGISAIFSAFAVRTCDKTYSME